MASTYPVSQDVFPGTPYTDFTEYIFAAFANAWVSALGAIETTIGFGTAGTAANPLYSNVFNATYSTLTARITHAEGVANSAVQLDGSVGDIQAVGSTAALGSTGKAPDAGHVHVGVKSVNGRSGTITLGVNDLASLFTGKGTLLVGTGNGAVEVLPGPTANSGQCLMAFGADPSNLSWVVPDWLPGDLKFTSATALPTGWVDANNQTLSRTGQVNLFNASTYQTTATLVNGNATINNVSSAITAMLAGNDDITGQPLAAGMPVEGPNIPNGTTIVSVGSTSLVLSHAPTNGGSFTITIFPYGNGDGSTTFNVIDMRGRGPLGMGGIASNGQPTFIMGNSGGERRHNLGYNEVPDHSHSVNDPSHKHFTYLDNLGPSYEFLYTTPTVQSTTINTTEGQGAGKLNFSWSPAFENAINAATTGISIQGAGYGGQPHNTLSPFAVGRWLVKL